MVVVVVVVVAALLKGVCTKRSAMVMVGLTCGCTVDFFQNGRGYKNVKATT
jgi:hypothetical protein